MSLQTLLDEEDRNVYKLSKPLVFQPAVAKCPSRLPRNRRRSRRHSSISREPSVCADSREVPMTGARNKLFDGFDYISQQRAALDAQVSLPTLQRVLRGERVRPASLCRVRRVLAERGLLHLLPNEQNEREERDP
jgi:hypothetical protein